MTGKREMTAKEMAWWKDLKKALRRMPKSVELNARIGGAIGIAPVGSREATFARYGDCDCLDEAEWESVSVPRLDGRDTHL